MSAAVSDSVDQGAKGERWHEPSKQFAPARASEDIRPIAAQPQAPAADPAPPNPCGYTMAVIDTTTGDGFSVICGVRAWPSALPDAFRSALTTTLRPIELGLKRPHGGRNRDKDLGMGRGARPQRPARESTSSAVYEAYYRGAGDMRRELDFYLERLDEVIAAVDRWPELTVSQRSRLSAMLLRVRTGYRGPLEP